MRRRSRLTLPCAISATILLSCCPALGQDAREKQEEGQPAAAVPASSPAGKLLSLDPAPEAIPALRYRLLPTVTELRPGSAAPIYMRITKEKPDAFEQMLKDSVKWADVPPADLPHAEVRQYLSRLDTNVFQRISLAALRDRCDWEYPVGEVPAMFMLLPDVQEMRTFARVLAVKAKIEIAEGRFDDALKSIREGFAMARHVARGPFIVQQLVAIAIATIMVERVEEWIAEPGAPNLYWALASLPRPLIDIHNSLEMEARMLEYTIPGVADIDRKRTDAEWRQLWMELSAATRFDDPDANQADLLKLFNEEAVSLPQSKRFLIEEERMKAAEVDAMPVSQVLVLHQLLKFARLRDEQFKWFALPYHQAASGLAMFQQELEEAKKRENTPAGAGLVFSMGPVVLAAPARLQRSLAALRVVEALRMYAAEHAGRLPPSLEEIKLVPVPKDPLLDRAFQYGGGGDAAILTAHAPDGEGLKTFSLRYRLTIRQPQPEAKDK